MLGAALAALAAVPVLWPMIFFFAADDQSFAGIVGAIFTCVGLGGVIALAGALCGVLIGGLISLFTRGKRNKE